MKRLLKGSAVYGVGAILQKFLGLLLLPFFTRALTPEDYGVIALVMLLSTALSGIFNLGTGNSLGIFYFKEEDRSRRHRLVWTNAALLLFNSIVLFTLLYAAAPTISRWIFQTEADAGYLRIALGSLALMTMTEPFYAWLRMEERARMYVILSLLGSLVTLGMSVWFVLGLKWGVTGYLLGSLVGYALMLALVLTVVGKRVEFGIEWSRFAPLVKTGIPSVFGLFAFLLIDYADRQMLQRMAGLDVLGVYSVGYSFGMIMLIFVGAFGSAWPPFFMSYVKKREEAAAVFGKVLYYYLLGFGMLTLLFFAFARPVTALMVSPTFAEAYKVCGLVAAAYLFKGVYLIMLPGIYFAEKLAWQSGIEWCAALVNLGLNYLWIPKYGMVGAALATLVSYIVLSVLAWYTGKKYLHLLIDWRKLSLVIVVYTFGAMILNLLSLGVMDFGYFFVYSLSTLGGVFFVIYYIVLRREERKVLRKYYKRYVG